MMKLEKRETFSSIMALALPIVAEEILSTLLQYVDTAMVGRLGAEATASVNLTSTVNWLLGSLMSSFGIAIVAMISSSYGRKDREGIKRQSATGFLLSLALGLTLFAICLSISPFLPTWMNADPAIRKRAGEYFFIISLALPFRSLSVMAASSMRAIKDSKTPMVVNLSQNLVNIILNYILIYPMEMGVRGAAAATFVSYTLGSVVMAQAAYRKKELSFSRNELKNQKPLIKEALSIALPASATNTTSCLGHITFASLVSSMGTITFAAHSIALSAETIFYVPGYGLRGATSTLIGISVGEGDRKKFKEIEHLSIAITVVMMTFTGLLLHIFAYPIMKIFTPDQRVVEMGAEVLKMIALSEPIFGLMIVSEGICYGLGDTKFPFAVETFGAWGIRILLSVLGLKYLGISLFGVWICMLLDNMFRALALFIPLISGRDRKLYEKRRKGLER